LQLGCAVYLHQKKSEAKRKRIVFSFKAKKIVYFFASKRKNKKSEAKLKQKPNERNETAPKNKKEAM
jgi:hypothetical protein